MATIRARSPSIPRRSAPATRSRFPPPPASDSTRTFGGHEQRRHGHGGFRHHDAAGELRTVGRHEHVYRHRQCPHPQLRPRGRVNRHRWRDQHNLQQQHIQSLYRQHRRHRHRNQQRPDLPDWRQRRTVRQFDPRQRPGHRPGAKWLDHDRQSQLGRCHQLQSIVLRHPQSHR